MALKDEFPPVGLIVEMEVEELGPFILKHLKGLRSGDTGDLHRNNFITRVLREYSNDDAASRFMEAWMWLEREGFIVPHFRQTGEWFQVSRKGERVLEEENFQAYQQAAKFPAHIDPVLVRTVKPLFMRGDYDTAVFRAFKEVEVRVRKKAGLSFDDYGRELMGRAFGTTGRLRNKAAPKGEQDAMRELFGGALGQCKNPSSHREVVFADAEEVMDLICFANQLLRMVDRIDVG